MRLSIAFLLLSFNISAQQEKEYSDTLNAKIQLEKSKQLQFVDALAARDITYEWGGKIGQTDFHKLIAEYNLYHAQHDQMCGSIEASIEVFSRAINAGLKYDSSSVIIAEAYARKGNALNKRGESELGLKEILKAKRIYEDKLMPLEVAWCEALIADCYRQQELFLKSSQKLNTAIQNLEKFKNTVYLLDAYHIYGKLIYHINELDTVSEAEIIQAGLYIEKALLISKKINNSPYIAISIKQKADLFYIQKKYNEALPLYLKAHKIFMKTNFLLFSVETKLNEARNLSKLNKYEDVITTLQEPVELAAKSGWLVELHYMYSVLAVAHSALGHNREGAINGSRAFTIYKHIVKEKREFEMEALEANYEKEKQILISAKQKQESIINSRQRNYLIIFGLFLIALTSILIWSYYKIKKTNKELNKNIAQKEVLLQEVHHRVKNNMTLLKSLLYLRSKSSDNKEVKVIMDECQARIQSMALIHQSLYNVNDSSEIDFDMYLVQLFNDLKKMFDIENNKIDLKINSNNVKLEIRNSIFLGLIVNEFITNSFKYAFHKIEIGQINIELSKEGEVYKLTYFDNGPGISENFDSQKSHGFGFKLINILVSQMNAKLSYEKDKFGTFKILIPIEKNI